MKELKKQTTLCDLTNELSREGRSSPKMFFS